MTPQYQKRLVAFVDILGFRSLVQRSMTNRHLLETLFKSLTYFKTWELPFSWTTKIIEIEEDAQKKGLSSFKIEDNTTCTCFSDTIVISVLFKDNKLNESFSTLVANLSAIGAYMITQGVLVRGSIAVGDIIHKDSGVVFGPGLIEAYELEQTISSMPRIIISESLVHQLNYPLEMKSNRYPYHQYLDRFDDGCVGFHQMIFFQVIQSWTEFPNSQLKSQLKAVKNVIISGLDDNFANPSVFKKYAWLKDEYAKLIILEKELKEQIHEPSEADSRHNVHYSNIDKVFYRK